MDFFFDRQLGDFPASEVYKADEICWQLNGALPFANHSFHDNLVHRSIWDGQNLVMELDPGFWFKSDGELASTLSITFVNAQVLHQKKWFDGAFVRWLYHGLRQIDGGYEVDIKATLVVNGCESAPQAERQATLTIRATDILLSIDGEVLPPEIGQLPVGDLIFALSRNAPEARQQQAKAHIVRQPNFPYIALILPIGYKDCWEGCAEILCALSDDALQPLLPGMLHWLIDLSWPGAQMVRNRLIHVQAAIMKPALEAVVRRACDERDDLWLANLSELLGNQRLADVLSEDTLKILLP